MRTVIHLKQLLLNYLLVTRYEIRVKFDFFIFLTGQCINKFDYKNL